MRINKVFLALTAIVFLIIPLSAQPVPLLMEDFEGTFPPAGWSVYASGGQNQWYRNDFWGRANFTPGSNGFCADNDDAGAGPGAARTVNNCLQSATFDASNYTVVWLAWDVDWYPVGSALQGKVEVYDGSGWYAVMSYALMHLTQRDSINISSLVAGKAGGRVRFLYTELSGGVKSNWYEVDDVRVWGSEPPEPLDLVMVDVIRPQSFEKAGIAFRPTCKIYNNLDTAAHATVTCKIVELPSYQQVYSNSMNNYACVPGYTMVEFTPFTPGENKTYSATFSVMHPNDIDNSNNTMERLFTTVEKNVTPIMMMEPDTPIQYGPFPPTAVFRELAGRQTPSVVMLCTMKPVPNPEDTVVYHDTTAARNFGANESDTTVFDSATTLVPGMYEIIFWAKDNVDPNISYPPLVDTFEYRNLGSVDEKNPVSSFYMEEITPNPATGIVNVRFILAQAGWSSLIAYDASGRFVENLLSANLEAGSHSVIWNPNNLPRGVYFITLATPGYSSTRRLLLLD